MNYEEFKKALIQKVTEGAGEDAEITVHRVPKNNGVVLDGLTIMKKGRNIAPTIYLDSYYEKYTYGVDVEDLAQLLLNENKRNELDIELSPEIFTDFERIRDKVLYRLVNFDMNVVLLKDVPYIRMLDLAMIFYYVVDEKKLERATVVIRNSDLVRWNITPHELWKIAVSNTPHYEPAVIRSMQDVLQGMCGMGEEEDDTDERPENERNVNDGSFLFGADEEEPEDEKNHRKDRRNEEDSVEESEAEFKEKKADEDEGEAYRNEAGVTGNAEDAEDAEDEDAEDGDAEYEDAEDEDESVEDYGNDSTDTDLNPPVAMYVLTNRHKLFGASCMAYENVFAELSGKLNKNLFILPSSIHEVILTPDTGHFTKDDLEAMVTEINATHVAPHEVLSNHVYTYDRVSGIIAL